MMDDAILENSGLNLQYENCTKYKLANTCEAQNLGSKATPWYVKRSFYKVINEKRGGYYSPGSAR